MKAVNFLQLRDGSRRTLSEDEATVCQHSPHFTRIIACKAMNVYVAKGVKPVREERLNYGGRRLSGGVPRYGI